MELLIKGGMKVHSIGYTKATAMAMAASLRNKGIYGCCCKAPKSDAYVVLVPKK